jgi:hypothetical protein
MHSIMHVKEPSQNEIEEKTFGTDVSFWRHLQSNEFEV